MYKTLGVVTHGWNPNTEGAETGGLAYLVNCKPMAEPETGGIAYLVSCKPMKEPVS